MKRRKEIWELIITLLLIAGCHATKQLQQLQLPVFDKQGHRGARGLMPENTIPAMLKAIELKVTTLEMDVVITQDEQVILSHEPFFNHEITTRADGRVVEAKEEHSLNIFKMPYVATQQFDVGLKIHPRFPQQQKIAVRKPLLAAVIDSVENYCKQHALPPPFYNIETKTQPATDNIFHPAPEAFVDILVKQILQKGIADRVVIQSFDFRTLQVLHKKYPAIKTAALIEDFDKKTFEEHIQLLGFTPTIYSPAFVLVNAALIEKCHTKNIKIIPWTVNDEKKIAELKQLGVDGIITDYPGLLSE